MKLRARLLAVVGLSACTGRLVPTEEDAGSTGGEPASASSGVDPSSTLGSVGSAVTGSADEGVAPTDATNASTSTGPDSVCGDGIVEGDEHCDDGNDVDEDACDNTCVEPCGIRWSIAMEPGIDGKQGILPVALGQKAGGGARAWGAAFVDLAPRMWIGEYAADGTLTGAIDAGVDIPADALVWDTAIDAAGRLLVIGSIAAAGGEEALPMAAAYDPDGGEAWAVELTAPLEPNAERVGIAASPTGDVAISAPIRIAGDDTDAWVAALDGPTGATAWSGSISGPFDGGFSLDHGGRLAMGSDGTVFAVAALRKSYNRRDVALVAFAPGTGAVQWAVTPIADPGANHDQVATDVALDADGNPLLAVTVATPSSARGTVFAFDPDGTPRWTFAIADDAGIDARDFARTSIAIGPDGDIALAGELVPQGADSPEDIEAFIARLDPDTAAVHCAAAYSDADYRSPAALTVTDDDDILLAGGPLPGPGGPGSAAGWLTAIR